MSYLGKCDLCGYELDAEFVDIGVGFQQVTEARCGNGCEHFFMAYDEYEKEQKAFGNEPEAFEKWLEGQGFERQTNQQDN